MSNQLANESSPYLLQHKDNPVHWYPWCAEALLRARADDKPIFLSIGYSACHWCHVMEHESFENEQIADFLNRHFISIKVDREERPDLDQIYMQAVMAMNGHGGWPLSAFLTPDQEFFFGGTYWPATTTAQMPGFDRVLASVLDAWHNNRENVLNQSREITQLLGSRMDAATGWDSDLFQAAAQILHNRFDNTFGGFGSAPKFPHPVDLLMLLAFYRRNCEQQETNWDGPAPESLLEMVDVTITKMARGGIYDHLAGGFARYSVDSRWLVPHFEKMLYDNALLVPVLLQTWQITGNEEHREAAEETLDYLLEKMQDPAGGFYSTEDADSEGVEGKFYVWTVDEVHEVLGDEMGTQFCALYDVTHGGNFEGSNILNLPQSIEDFARASNLEAEPFRDSLQVARQQLKEARQQRVPPGLDDKVLTSWNGLAIHAMAEAAIVMRHNRYAEAAKHAGEFIWNEMRQADGRLLHSWRNGQARLPAYLDDYACLINSFISLFRVEFDSIWIDRAWSLAESMVNHFQDPENGCFFFTADDHEKLIVRNQEFQDAAVPSGNAMAATALIRLGILTGDQDMATSGFRATWGAVPLLKRAPQAAAQTLIAAHLYLHGQQVSVLVTGTDTAENDRCIQCLQHSIPINQALIVVESDNNNISGHLAGMLNGKRAIDGKATLYRCDTTGCQAPVVGPDIAETGPASTGYG